MSMLIMTKGLPASGKTTWAKEQQRINPNIVRVNKDELRAMLHLGKWSKENEKQVLRIRDQIIFDSLTFGRDVICDDTNFASKHQERFIILAQQTASQLVIKEFTDVSLEECIKRDQQRTNYVGEKVIRKMYNQYCKPVIHEISYDHSLEDCIICDLDGTLALFGDANPYDRDFIKDQVNIPVKELLLRESEKAKIILVSGRKGIYKEQTEVWLKYNNIPYDKIFMRSVKDSRKDAIIKQEIYERDIEGKYNVLYVLDDRNQVVEFWRSQGLSCFQVAEGDF